jgi:hypothetical protein
MRSTLPLGLADPIGTSGHEPMMVCEVEEDAVVAMQPGPWSSSIGQLGAHVVAQDLARNTAKIVTPARDGQVALQSLIGDEFHIGRPAPAESNGLGYPVKKTGREVPLRGFGWRRWGITRRTEEDQLGGMLELSYPLLIFFSKKYPQLNY